MIYVYITSSTRKILHKAVAGDDCQDLYAPSGFGPPESLHVNIIRQPRCSASHIATHLIALILALSHRLPGSIIYKRPLLHGKHDRMDIRSILIRNWPILIIAVGISGFVIGGIWLVVWQCLKTRELNREFKERISPAQSRHVHFDERLVLD